MKISLICQHGASTGMVVNKMKDAATEKGVKADIAAYPDSQLDNIVADSDIILAGPQVSFKVDGYKKKYPEYADKFHVINTMDFGMMNGEKILNDALEILAKK